MQDIIIPKHKEEIIESMHKRVGRERPPRRNTTRMSKRKVVWGVGILALLGIAWMVVVSAHGAEVTIIPHTETISFNDTIIFTRASTTPGDAVGYQIMTLRESAETEVPATTKQTVTEKAKGAVILYNKTNAPQRLVARTRLTAASGKIYRIAKDVTIPAQKTVSGKAVPGSAEVAVEAALPGEEYNTGLTDFTIAGFVGTPKFSQFYGRSKTKIEGGFSGERLIAGADSIQAARTSLKNTLADKLAKQAVDSLPEGWILYKDGTFLDVAETQTNGSGDNTQTILLKEQGTLLAVLVSKEDMLRYVRNHKITDDANTIGYSATGLENLEFTIANRPELNIQTATSFAARLKGEAKLSALVSPEALTADLEGVSSDKAAEVFKKYAGIERAEFRISPSFLQSFPDTKDRIRVSFKTEEALDL